MLCSHAASVKSSAGRDGYEQRGNHKGTCHQYQEGQENPHQGFCKNRHTFAHGVGGAIGELGIQSIRGLKGTEVRSGKFYAGEIVLLARILILR